MKPYIIQFLIILKKQLRNPGFLFLLIALPLSSIFLTNMTVTSDTTIYIPIYSEDPIADEILANLTKEIESFTFYRAASVESLKEDVATKKAECGYIFDRNFSEKLQDTKVAKTITCVTSSHTVLNAITDEIIHGYAFPYLTKAITLAELKKSAPLKEHYADISSYINQHYDSFFENGATNLFEINYLTELSAPPSSKEVKNVHIPFRGIVTLMILLAGILGSISWLHDFYPSLFRYSSAGDRRFGLYSSILINILLMNLSGLVCMLISNTITHFAFDLFALLIYDLLIFGFCLLLIRLFSTSERIMAFTPIYIVGCIVCTPVIANLGVAIPLISYLQHFFLPNYFLRASLATPSFLLTGFLLAIALIIVGDFPFASLFRKKQ